MADSREPGRLYWKKLEPIADSISIYEGPEVFLRQFSVVHPALGNLLAAHWCQSEVTNGGFLQFFETVNLDREIAKVYEPLQVKLDLYISPCLDVIDGTASHHKYDFALDHKVLDVLEDLAGRLYHAEYAHCLLVHDKHVLIDASASVEGPLLVSSRIPESEVRKFAQRLKTTYELSAL